MTGIARKKVNSAAAGRATPIRIPPKIVTPERDVLGSGRGSETHRSEGGFAVDFFRRLYAEVPLLISRLYEQKRRAVENKRQRDDERRM